MLPGYILLQKPGETTQNTRQGSVSVPAVDNTHRALKLFTGRADPAGRDEQYEKLFVGLVDDNQVAPSIRYFEAGNLTPISLDKCLDALLRIVVDRDPDLWALIGPNDEKEPGPEDSPLSIAGFSRSGALLKRTSIDGRKKSRNENRGDSLLPSEEPDPDEPLDESEDAE